jgi:large subunit ribosomal protein L16
MPMLMPARTKYRKSFRGRRKGRATRGNTVEFGNYGMQAEETAWITSRQIEAARKVISHTTKRAGKSWIRIFPHKPVTKKPAEVKMGSGKGDVDHYVAVVKRGRILFELDGVSAELARKALILAGNKMPIKVKFVIKGEEENAI